MIENLTEHGLQPGDLVPALMTTHTVANPEYDPAEAQRQADMRKAEDEVPPESDDISEVTVVEPSTPPKASPSPPSSHPPTAKSGTFQTTSRGLQQASTSAVPGVSP